MTDTPLTELEGLASRVFLPAHNWQTATGDAGKAAALLSPESARGCFLAIRPGEEDLLLSLFAESLQLLNPTGRASTNAWRHTFTTFVQGQDNLSDFRWRGGWPGTPGFAKVKQAGGSVLEPRAIVAPLSELAIIAREGKVPVSVTQVKVEPRRPAVPSILTTQPPAKPALLSVSPPKPSIRARLLERGHRSTHGIDTEMPLPAAPQENHRSWLTWLLAFASSLLVCLLATYPLWKGALQDLKKSSPRTPSAPTSPPITPPPTNTPSSPPLRPSAQGPVWLFLGKRFTDINLSEIPLLTNLMSQIGGAPSSTTIRCFLHKTNELATNLFRTEDGQELPITMNQEGRLHFDWHFRLGYEAERRRVKWLPDPEEGKLLLNQEQTNFWTSITFTWTDRVSGQPMNVSLVLLNSRSNLVSRPFPLPKHYLIPDKSGPNRYAPDFARFQGQFKLGDALEWRLVPMIDSNSLYHDWIPNSRPGPDEEINFAETQSRLADELKTLQNKHSNLSTNIANLQSRLQLLEEQDLKVGEWLKVDVPVLLSFSRFCRDIEPDQRATDAFRFYLNRLLTVLQAGSRSRSDRSRIAALYGMLTTNNISGVCREFNNLISQRSPDITNSLESYYDSLGDTRVRDCAQRGKDIEEHRARLARLVTLYQLMQGLSRQTNAVASGCWEKITEIQLRIEPKTSGSPSNRLDSVLFARFLQPTNSSPQP
ncbi:MAG TPA: hypothetical protein PLF11_08950 [Bacillota bacterium]|nr:hypothetical protein [Bacillota bacterium]